MCSALCVGVVLIPWLKYLCTLQLSSLEAVHLYGKGYILSLRHAAAIAAI